MSALAPDWLGAARAATEELRSVLAAAPTTAQRARETGTRGEGGDRTLEIDAAAEEAVFRRLDALHAQGARFAALSEERGRVDFGCDAAAPVLVVIDPLDGSKNAKRGLPHHALSLAVAHGVTMADVVLGFVYDFGPGEEWVARQGGGAVLNGVRLDPGVPERRVGGKLELLGIESADPIWVRESADALAGAAHRLRALGAIAVSLCQVAAARLDGMVTLRRCRAVDVAAGQLIVREAGGVVAFTGCSDPLGAPLDVMEPVSPVVAARSVEGLAELARVPTNGGW
ncbi:MAG TPA: inositol monophosphatase family protein [Solirubrobacteraceae bacterium]|nr:inositol monophosphatase family protein [Solirubrobacteraceae bacterium]